LGTAPTSVGSRDVLGVEDYFKKLGIPIQQIKSTSISDGFKREKIYFQLQTRGMNLQCCRKEDAPVAILLAVLLFFMGPWVILLCMTKSKNTKTNRYEVIDD
jgi:hypothetical protein